MKSSIGFVFAIVVLAILATLSGAMFQVAQTEQALVLRFGAPVAGRGLITEPGLHFKIPMIETVVRVDASQRLLDDAKVEAIKRHRVRL